MTTKLSKFTFKKSKWCSDRFLNERGEGCLLGQFLLQCGVPKERLLENVMDEESNKWFLGRNAKIANRIVDVNDDELELLSDKVMTARRLFNQLNITMRVED